MHQARTASLIVVAVALTACDGQQQPANGSAPSTVPPPLPAEYFTQPPPPPEPEPPPPPEPEPPPPPPEPEPPPPPPEPDADAIARAERAALDLRRNRERRQAAPAFFTPPSQPTPAADPTYRTTHPDYEPVGAPGTLSGFPVDREFIITQARRFTATLLDPINSQLPGDVRFVVDQDVYGPGGTHKLLQRGDVLIGRYEPLNEIGDTRLNVSIYRIERMADGATVYQAAGGEGFAVAGDAEGKVGLIGQIDSRMWERYGHAALTAGLSVAPGLVGMASGQQDQTTAAVQQQWGQQMAAVTQKLLDESVKLEPIITVSGGTQATIILSRDIYLRRPELL